MSSPRTLTVACALAVIATGIAARAPAVDGREAAAQPAVWRTYDMIVDLEHLPTTYTCDQLWYEFHGILLRLRVPAASLSILPYRCSPNAAGRLRSPHVELRFRMPSVVSGPETKWRQLSAVRRTVTIAPGRPRTLRPSDCHLLRQIRRTLLGALPVTVTASDLHCTRRGRQLFGLTVREWVAKRS